MLPTSEILIHHNWQFISRKSSSDGLLCPLNSMTRLQTFLREQGSLGHFCPTSLPASFPLREFPGGIEGSASHPTSCLLFSHWCFLSLNPQMGFYFQRTRKTVSNPPPEVWVVSQVESGGSMQEESNSPRGSGGLVQGREGGRGPAACGREHSPPSSLAVRFFSWRSTQCNTSAI